MPENDNIPDDKKCQKCGKPVDGCLHSCPFAEEMSDDYSENCNCCSECSGDCAMDI